MTCVPTGLAGLMSPLEVGEIGGIVKGFVATLPDLGLPHVFPSALLAIALPVIPHVRLTDLGLVDVAAQRLIPIGVS